MSTKANGSINSKILGEQSSEHQIQNDNKIPINHDDESFLELTDPKAELYEFEEMVKKYLSIYSVDDDEENASFLEELKSKYEHLHYLAETPEAREPKNKNDEDKEEHMMTLVNLLIDDPTKTDTLVDVIHYFLTSGELQNLDERILTYAKYLKSDEFRNNDDEFHNAHFANLTSPVENQLYPGSDLTNLALAKLLRQMNMNI